MRYVATLQRFDDANTDVATSDDRCEVIDAAIVIYKTLIPTILERGGKELEEDMQRLVDDNDETGRKELLTDMQTVLIAAQLSAREWGVGVYDRGRLKRNGEYANKYPEMIFWIGATREKVSV